MAPPAPDRLQKSQQDFESWPIDEKLEVLNAIYPVGRGWESVTSRKEHIDEFGDVIKHGETYYKLWNGGAFGSEYKLSQRSISTLIGLVLRPIDSLLRLALPTARKRNEQAWEEMQKAADALDAHFSGKKEPPQQDN